MPQPKNANRVLLDIFGYAQRKKRQDLSDDAEIIIPANPAMAGDKEIHVTVDAIKYNSIGLKLALDKQKLILQNEKNANVYCEKEYLRSAFEKKYNHKLLYVLADKRTTRGKPEEFWYNEILLLNDTDFNNFLELITTGFDELPKVFNLMVSNSKRVFGF